ncbi:VanW like protein [Pseudobutyrivibrio sp. UC1225]|uniref:VanW family protein n=1 Tax=Pseudobutyrivibrio sp. UC1225 TaxID=1798185 RepID=UPI0008EDAA6D|nr:VanW family protein [Pseudobutyrivibrio sp. UC1225]SFO20837.1 VanW like protein [Pseudobutyrivibrio sp. UC1225]
MKKMQVRTVLSLVMLGAALSIAPKLNAEAAYNDELLACSKIFDADYYATMYPDAAAASNGSKLWLLNHYLRVGIYEGRNASATFNATDYKNKNADLEALYGDYLPGYAFHYAYSGKAEGRDATPSVGAEVSVPSTYTLLGVYATEYDPESARGGNIQIAASHVNGTVVAPGQTFSANKAIGPRTHANGFVDAPVFINKEHAIGVGGGVCQVSSTIYAAMKVAGVKATERHPHSLPVNYLPEGWDATISGNELDLKFKNTYGKNLIVYENAAGGILTVALYLEN